VAPRPALDYAKERGLQGRGEGSIWLSLLRAEHFLCLKILLDSFVTFVLLVDLFSHVGSFPI